jgi:hypothetical protein
MFRLFKKALFAINNNLKIKLFWDITPCLLVVNDVSEDFDASKCRVVLGLNKDAVKNPPKSHKNSLCPLAERTVDCSTFFLFHPARRQTHHYNYTFSLRTAIIRTNRLIPPSVFRGLSLEELLPSSFVFMSV